MKSEVIITESDLPDEVVQAIKDGRKVVAIKLLCDTTGIGMANAKVLVDRAAQRLAPRPPRQTLMKDYKRSNSRSLGLLLVLALAFAAWKILGNS